jgi:murein DD-endopeptidase MepM/ murein hydrolase activator NlpD
MARIKYYYDTATCRYEVAKTPPGKLVLRMMTFMAMSLIAGACITWLYINFAGSPQEKVLKRQNKELKLYYEMLDKQVDEASKMLSALQHRDDNIYRVILEAEPIPASIRKAGIGGASRYAELLEKNLSYENLIVGTTEKLDKLKKQMYIQTKSYDEIIKLSKNKNEMLSSVPAIQPVSNKQLKLLTSGFGKRIDPVYKTVKMHSGIDFSAPSGTKIYATGKGEVKSARFESGYGNCVVIDHGFGYQTRYAHMSKINVKKGQRIRRGDILGFVGSTGKSTGPHLHYEVVKNGQRIDPINFFFNDLTPEQYQEMLEASNSSNLSFD